MQTTVRDVETTLTRFTNLTDVTDATNVTGEAEEKRRVRITMAGTSFLLPGNAAWNRLREACDVQFGDPGEWSSLLFRAPHADVPAEMLVLAVFLQDVLDRDQIDRWPGPDKQPGAQPDSQIDGWLAPLLDAIDHALSIRGKQPLLVSWSYVRASSPIAFARHPTAWDAIAARWESQLLARQAQWPNLFVLPMDRLFAAVGRNHCFDARNFYAARCRLSQPGLAVLAGGIREIADRWQRPAKKVLAIDCDNTLWGGVVGEDGLAGLRLGEDGVGAAFADFQRAVKELALRGTLLVLVSKNQEEDVWRVFDEHPGMVLRRADIAAAAINWKPKTDNLEAIAEELGLGLDSFVFWDDNPIERESVRHHLPSVTVPEVPGETWDWPEWMERSELFARFKVTEEDQRRTGLYQARSQFHAERTQSRDEAGFLKSINLRARALPISDGTIARAVQLTQKTNQFNLRSQRYDEAGLRQVMAAPDAVAFLAHLSDRFGDHGNAGFALAHRIGVAPGRPWVAFLDTFLLSCRVLGCHLEAWMLDQCIQQLKQSGASYLIAEYIPSGRNMMAASFLQDHGFVAQSNWPDDLCQILRPHNLRQSGTLFAADLSKVTIPHLDIFSA